MNFGKFLRTPFLQNTSGRLLLPLNPMKEAQSQQCIQKMRFAVYSLILNSEPVTMPFSVNLFRCSALTWINSSGLSEVISFLLVGSVSSLVSEIGVFWSDQTISVRSS